MIRFITCLLLTLSAGQAAASQCQQIADRAGLHFAALRAGEVRIRYVAHSAFRIETDQGRAVVTDYFGAAGPGPAPDAVTMNHAHSTHWTPYPDPAIRHPLKGWADAGQPREHWLYLDDLLIRNVHTAIRSWKGGWEDDGNSVFIFEYEGLCIGHLGHLHHMPTDQQFALIGRLDVVMAPVDGGQTLPVPVMVAVLKRLKARVVIPMHHWSAESLRLFLAGMADEFAVDTNVAEEMVLSAATLPSRPTVRLLAPVGVDPVFEE